MDNSQAAEEIESESIAGSQRAGGFVSSRGQNQPDWQILEAQERQLEQALLRMKELRGQTRARKTRDRRTRSAGTAPAVAQLRTGVPALKMVSG